MDFILNILNQIKNKKLKYIKLFLFGQFSV